MTDISAVNPFAPTAASSAAPSVGDSLGADVFLQLLVAQLKYQDPTSPAEGTEFLAQTAQFTMVEKLTQIAEQTESTAQMNRNLGAASLVGRSISWLQNDGTTGQGVVQSARLGSAGPVLVVNGRDVAFDAVSAVTTSPTTPTAQPRATTIAAPAPATAPITPTPTPSTTTDRSTEASATDGTTEITTT